MELALDLPWTRVGELVAGEIGLFFPPERHADLRRGIGAAAAEAGLSVEAFVERLFSQKFSEDDVSLLARHLTIGETYFFRDAKTFDLLAQRILPTLIESRRKTRSLQIWSAGCCTGQEAYSMAILLLQLMPDLEKWSISIFGTDVNSSYLEQAATGVYGEWSFRETPEWFKLRFFENIEGKQWAIRPEIKKLVRFAPLNLVAERYPFPFENRGIMDLILCRNVLMYFSLPQARKVVERLRSIIREDGWLVAAPSEGAQVMAKQFVPVAFPGVILYKPATNRTEPAPAPPIPLADYPIPAAPRKKKTRNTPRPASQTISYPEKARALADRGDLPAALACCEHWITAEKLNPAAHYLKAVILQESANFKEARQSLHRALYIQPRHILAHFTLANLARELGANEEATRHFDNALDLLRGCPPDEPLPESGGITAARLQEMIRTIR